MELTNKGLPVDKKRDKASTKHWEQSNWAGDARGKKSQKSSQICLCTGEAEKKGENRHKKTRRANATGEKSL